MIKKNKKVNTSATIFLIITFLAILLFTMDLGGFLIPFRSKADIVTNPIRFWFFQKNRAISTFFRDLSSISSLRGENSSLKIKVLELEEALSEQAEIRRENEILRNQLDLKLEDEYFLVKANIIGSDYRPANSNIIIIDKGEKNGVNLNDTVVYGNYLVGRIKDLTEYSATIALVTETDINVPAVSEKNRTKGIVNGDINSGLIMTKILREEKIEVGEKILTSGMGIFPKGIIIGYVSEIRGQDTDVEKIAVIKDYIDLKNIEELFILNDKKN